MDHSQGINLPPSELKRLTVLDWIYDNGGNIAGAMVDLNPLFEERDGDDGRALMAELRDFQVQRWADLIGDGMSMVSSCSLTPSGIAYIEAIRRRRDDPMRRRMAARDAVLRWLYASNVKGNPAPDMSDFTPSPYGTFYGLDFTAQETVQAITWLMDQDYLKGAKGWSSTRAAGARITTKGEQLVESGGSVNDVAPASAAAHAPVTVKVKASRNININTNSPSATQSVTITEDNRSQVVNVADALEGMLGALGLDAPRTMEAQAIVRDLREMSAEPLPEPGRLRQLLDKAASVAIAGTGKAAGSALAALIAETVKGLSGG